MSCNCYQINFFLLSQASNNQFSNQNQINCNRQLETSYRKWNLSSLTSSFILMFFLNSLSYKFNQQHKYNHFMALLKWDDDIKLLNINRAATSLNKWMKLRKKWKWDHQKIRWSTKEILCSLPFFQRSSSVNVFDMVIVIYMVR